MCIHEEKLKQAWKKIFMLYRPLRCSYKNGMISELEDNQGFQSLKVIDLSGLTSQEQDEEELKLRDIYSHRNLDIENGECCGLIFVKKAQDKGKLIFDWDLSVGDVRSFVNVLEMLCNEYISEENETSAPLCMPDERKLLAKRKEKAKETRVVAKQIITIDIPGYKTEISLPFKKDPTSLSHCKYKAVDSFADESLWKALRYKVSEKGIPIETALAFAFGNALMSVTNDDEILLNIPWFSRNPEEQAAVGDFTDIKIIPIKNHNSEISEKALKDFSVDFERYMEFSGYSITKLKKQIAAEHGLAADAASGIAPVVFSPMTEAPLLSDKFQRHIGKIKYMISQTPQVAIDAQSFELNGGLYISLVYPCELFEEGFIKKISEQYIEILKKIS